VRKCGEQWEGDLMPKKFVRTNRGGTTTTSNNRKKKRGLLKTSEKTEEKRVETKDKSPEKERKGNEQVHRRVKARIQLAPWGTREQNQ